MDFADAFGQDSAYMGWAWTMNVSSAQNWTSEFLNNLKGGRTVQEAYDIFLKAHGTLEDQDTRFMKIYGNTANVIDKNTGGGL